MTIENIRLSEKGKQQLLQLKKRTGIENWNTLCRWAFCTSLAEPSVPPYEDIPSDSSVEMTWKVFGGKYSELYYALLIERSVADGFDDPMLCLKLHLNRGVSFILNDSNITPLMSDYS